MKQFLLLLFVLLSCSASRAQTENKEIESSIEALNKAMLSQDKSVLEKLTAEELSYGHSTGLTENKKAFVQNILTGPVKFFSIDNSDQKISITDKLAIVRCISAIKGNNNGTALDLKIGILMIWQKQGNAWKLLARQGYRLP